MFALHANAKTAAVDALEKGVAFIDVENASFLDSKSAFLAAWSANAALPSTGKLYEKMVELIDDLPLVQFVKEELRSELRTDFDYSTEVPQQRLTSIAGYEDARAVAERLVESFCSLPRAYTFTLGIPDSVLPSELMGGQSLSVGSACAIARPDLLFAERFPLTHENPRVQSRVRGAGALALLIFGQDEWKSDLAYLQYRGDGLVGLYGGGNLAEKAQRHIESFIGLGLATRLFTYSRDYKSPELKLRWTIHRDRPDGHELFTRFDANEEFCEVVRHLKSFRFAANYPEESRGPWLLKMISQADKLFDHERGDTLLLSAKWFFDSHKGGDEMLHYIRMMTSIEILLGEHADTSRASLGELLGNRLAYLIGKNHRDRSEVLAEFRNIYKVRSGILHHGKHKLRGEERFYTSKLNEYCRRAIEKEVELILAD